mgnify:CR=1 FL=1
MRNPHRQPGSASVGGEGMKPHIKMVYGVWHCGIKGIPNRYLGIGDTPSAAYRDWVCNG